MKILLWISYDSAMCSYIYTIICCLSLNVCIVNGLIVGFNFILFHTFIVLNHC